MNREDFLQQQAESGKDDGTLDAAAYRRIFDALKRDSSPALSPSFADNIVSLVQERRSNFASRLAVFVAVTGGLGALGLLIIATLLTGFKLQLGFLEPLREFGGMFAFGAVLILFLNWIDKTMIRKKASI